MPSFKDLPFELVSEILAIAAEQNADDLDAATYTYGLTQAPRPMQNKAYIQKYLRGRVPTDVQRWQSVDAIRQVSTQWHEWALSHALRELYIRRWQGGETWMRRAFENALPVEILPVVYQNPYKSIESTVELFGDYPQLTRHVRKIWFNGIYHFDTVGYVFKILQNCRYVRTVTIPWTALRYGDSADWENVFSFPRLTSLEFLAVGLKNEVCEFPESHIDTKVLGKSPSLDFSKLRRLKIFGDSNLKPISDEDLFFMARTATNLEEILITNVTSITAKGVAALVSASRNTLKLLEFIPLAKDGFEPFQTPEDNRHICSLLASCPRLSDLAITVPSACPNLFSNPDVDWKETVRVRVGSHGIRGESDNRADNLTELLDSARTLLEKKNSDHLDIEIAVGPYLFEAKSRLVHGSYVAPKIASGNQWSPLELPSVKGPYGYTGLYGGGMKGEWSAIGEADFVEAVRAGLVNLDS